MEPYLTWMMKINHSGQLMVWPIQACHLGRSKHQATRSPALTSSEAADRTAVDWAVPCCKLAALDWPHHHSNDVNAEPCQKFCFRAASCSSMLRIDHRSEFQAAWSKRRANMVLDWIDPLRNNQRLRFKFLAWSSKQTCRWHMASKKWPTVMWPAGPRKQHWHGKHLAVETRDNHEAGNFNPGLTSNMRCTGPYPGHRFRPGLGLWPKSSASSAQKCLQNHM